MADAQAKWTMAESKLKTRWAKDVSPNKTLPDYPRPQMTRERWQNLNGLWDYGWTNADAEQAPAAWSGKILVPFPIESALSGVGKPSEPNKRLWYRRTFTIPAKWNNQRVLLHFGAVNYDSAIWVNGRRIGAHRGGYNSFHFDITDALKTGENELIVSAWNPLWADDERGQVLGKQRIRPEGIFYTAATGIWQTVWLEPVPAAHITRLMITPDIDNETVRVGVQMAGSTEGVRIEATAFRGNDQIANAEGPLANAIPLPVHRQHLWTPDDPYLYNLRVSLTRGGKPIDTVDSYFAMRKISLGKDEQGQTRIFLNNKFVFQVGALDQGYWPDGIYTAPTDAALRYDIEIAKKLGYNLLRKHAKVEPDRWYWWTDKLGMLVWQDMPQAFSGKNDALTDEAKRQWEAEWREEIAMLYSHPSIVVWTPFNEGWGQHDTEKIVALTKQLDPSRLVNNASGWTDKGVGDINDRHDYPGPGSSKPEPTRAAVNGEFGGVTMRVPGHVWTTNEVFGYGSVLTEARLVTKRYQTLLKRAYALRDEGCSAVVYTQITDVEQEINGILTYDRAVIKPDLAIVAAANRGEFPALPPNPNPDLLPTSEEDPQTWSYTTEQPADDWMQTSFDSGAWKTGEAGFGQHLSGIRTPWTTPDIWLRREVTLPAKLPENLDFLVFHDEDCEIYVNGVLAATAKGYVVNYINLPMNAAGRAALKPGKNLLAVHCHQTIGGQFIDVGIARRTEPPKPKPEKITAGDWQNLFDGKSLDGWKATGFSAPGEVKVEPNFQGKGAAIVVNTGIALSGFNWTNSDLPKTNYEIELEAMKIEGTDFSCGLTFPVGDSHASLIMGGWGGATVGISSIDDADASRNETTQYLTFPKNKWYKVRLRITPSKIEVWHDGKQIIAQNITGRKINLRRGEISQSVPLGISTYQTTAAFRNIRLRRLEP